jgi:hypothetical protein
VAALHFEDRIMTLREARAEIYELARLLRDLGDTETARQIMTALALSEPAPPARFQHTRGKSR